MQGGQSVGKEMVAWDILYQADADKDTILSGQTFGQMPGASVTGCFAAVYIRLINMTNGKIRL